MTKLLPAAILLALVVALTACSSKLDEYEVRQFIDKADEAARKRFAPAICELRGENFTMKRRFTSADSSPPQEMEIGRKLFCREAGSFSQIRQYKLERVSLAVDVAPDRKTAKVTAEYVETLPYYEPGMMPATPDDFRDFQIVESRDVSVVGIESGDIVFLSSDATSVQAEFVPKNQIPLPYD
jgi:hypothetical protein